MTASGLPAGVTATFSPNPVLPAASNDAGGRDWVPTQMTLTVADSVPNGLYPITVTATSGTASHSITYNLTVSSFTLTMAPASVTVTPGSTATYSGALSMLGGFGGLVTYGIDGLPSGATPSINPASASTSAPVAISIATLASTPPGTYPIRLTGTSGNAVATSPLVNLVLNSDFSLAASPAGVRLAAGTGTVATTIAVQSAGSFLAPVTLAVSGLPAGATASFSANPVQGIGSTSLTISVGGPVAGGTYVLTVTGTSGTVVRSQTVTLDVMNFAVSASPATLTLSGGGNTTSAVSLTMVDGFNSAVTFGTTGLPAGVSAAFAPQSSTTSTVGTMTVTVDSSVAAGTYPFTITATSGTLQQSSVATLVVTSDFSIAATPLFSTTAAASQIIYTVTMTAAPGFSSPAGLSISGLPANATGTFSPAVVSGSGSSTLTVNVPATVAAGTYAPTISATAGAITHTTAVSLTVQSFSFVAAPALLPGPAGGAATAAVTLTPLSGFASPVAFSASGLPAGATAGFSPATVSGSGATTLTVAIGIAVPAGDYPFNIVGTSGALVQAVPATLRVTSDFAIAATPGSQTEAAGVNASFAVGLTASPGLADTATFAVAGLPPNATAVFTPPTLTGSGSTLLAISVPVDAPGTSYPLTITATTGSTTHSTPVRLAVQNYSLSVSPEMILGEKAGNATATVTLAASGGFNSPVTLSASGLPNGITAGLSPASITGSGGSSLTLAIGASVASGAYPFTVTAAGGGIQKSATAILTVDVDSVDLSLEADQTSFRIGRTLSQQITVRVRAIGLPAAALSLSGLPQGVTAAFAKNPLADGDSTLVTFSAADSAIAGTYPLTIEADSAGIARSLAVTMTVGPDFAITVTPTSVATGAGVSTTVVLSVAVTVVPSPDFTDTVSLYASGGPPTDYNVGFNPTSVITGSGSTTYYLWITKQSGNGSYPLTIAGTASDGTSHSVVVPVTLRPDFDFAYGCTDETIVIGSTGGCGILFDWLGGLDKPLALSVTGLPAGATGSFSPDLVFPIDTIFPLTNLTISVPQGVAPGTYPVVVSATEGTIVHTEPFLLTVAPNAVSAFSLTASPNSITVAPGTAANYTATLDMGTSSDTVWFGSSGLPSGLYASFNPYSTNTSGPVPVTINTWSSTPPGTYSVTFQATSYNSVAYAPPVTLTVTGDFTLTTSAGAMAVMAGATNPAISVTTTATSGSWAPINLSVTGLPPGITATFATNPLQGSGTTLLALTAGASVPPGSYAATVTGISGQVTHSQPLTVVVGSYAVSASPTSFAGPPGGTATSTVVLSTVNGYNGTVTFAATGLPSGATAAFSPASRSSAGNATMTVTVGSAVAPGSYPIAILGSSAGLQQSAPATLIVTPDFAISASPASATVLASNNATYTVNIAAVAGLSNPTTLTIAGLPTNAAASFSPSSISGSGASTLTISVPATVAGGTYLLTLTGTNGSIAHTTTVTLVVQNFALSAAPTALNGGVGWSATSTVTLTAAGGFNSPVTFNATGLPAGVTATFNPTVLNANGATVLNVAIGSSVGTGTYPFTITGTSGALQQSVAATLTIAPDFSVAVAPTSASVLAGTNSSLAVTVTASAGLAGQTGFSVDGLPSGVTASFTPAAITGSGSTTLAINVAASAPGGTYTLTVTATDGSLHHTATATLTIQNFSLTLTPVVLAGPPGATTTSVVTLSMLGGFNSPVAFDTNGLPLGATFSFDPAALGSTGTATLFVSIAGGVAPGSYAFTVTGTSGALQWSMPATLSVEPGLPDLALSVNPGQLQLGRGSTSDSLNVSVRLTNGIAPAVLSVSGLPPGITGTFGQPTLNDGESTALTFATPLDQPLGSATFTVTAVSGGLIRSVDPQLTVTPDFSMTVTPTSLVGGASYDWLQRRTFTLTVSPSPGFTDPVSLAVSTSRVLYDPEPAACEPSTITGSGTATCTMAIEYTLPYDPALANGSYSITFTGTAGAATHSVIVPMTLQPDFVCVDCTSSLSVAVPVGGQGHANGTLIWLGGLKDPLISSVTGLPAGVTGTFTTNPSTFYVYPDDPLEAQGGWGLNLFAAPGVATGNYNLTVSITNGTIVHTYPLLLQVGNFTVTAAPASRTVAPGGSTTVTETIVAQNGFNGSCDLTVSGLPQDTTATFSQTPINSSGSSTVTLQTASTTPPGVYPLLLIGTSGTNVQSTPFTLVVGGDFTVSTSASTTTVTAGSSGVTNTVTIAVSGGFASPVTLGATGLPSGATATFATNPVNGAGTSVLTLSANATVAGGNYLVAITATSGSIVHSKNITLAVRNFSLAVTPAALSASAGTNASATVTLTMAGGYSSTVTFGTSGLPSGATATFSPTTRTSTGTTTLTIATTASVAAGVFPFTITGTNGSLQQTTAATLTVTPDFSLAATPSTGTVIPGGSTNFTVTVTASTGLTGAATFTVAGLPANASAGFSPASVTGSGSTTMTVSTTSGVVAGSYPLTVTATNGSLVHTAAVTLTVQTQGFTLSASPSTLSGPPGGTATSTVTLTMLGGYATAVNFSASGLPTGATAAFSPTSRTSTGTTTLTLTIATSVAAGNYSFTITGTSGSLVQSIPATLTVAPDFSLSSSPTTRTVVAAGSGTFTVTVTATAGLTGATALTVTGLPTNATAAFSPTSVTGSGTSTLTVTVPATVAGGTSTLTITGTNGSLVHSITVTLTVQNFTLAASPTTLSGSAGGTATSTVTLTMTGGYATAVNFTASGLPTGATAAFNPTSRTSTGTTALTVTIATSVAAGSYSFTITGTSGSLVQSSGATLTVTADFSLSSSPTTLTVVAGSNANYTVSVAATPGLTGATGLSVTGLPTNATAVFNPTSVTGSGSSILTVTVPTTVTAGSYPLTITGTDGSLVHNISVTLTVQAQSFTLSVVPSTLSGPPGGTATATVTLTMLNGYATAVNFSASGLPTGATAAFSPTSRTSTGTTALTVTIGTSVAAGNYSFNITGTSGSLVQSIPATLTVAPDFSLSSSPTTRTVVAAGSGTFTVTVTATAGLTGATALTVTGLPTNATAAFSPTSVTGSGTSTLTVTVPATVAGGTSTLTITGTNGSKVHSITVTLTVQNFTLSASPSTLSGSAGGTATSTVTLTMTGGYATAVTFGASGLPTGATAAFSPTSLTSTATTTLTVTIATSVAAGSYPFTITGTSGSLVQSIPATLTVTPDFSLSSSPTTRTVVAGGTGTFTVTVTATAGLTGATALTVTGLPTNATAAFSPTSVTGSGTSTLTVTVPATVAGGTSTLTITGTNGSKVHSITVTLTVQNFTLSASPSTLSGSAGGTATSTVTLTMTGGYATAVTFGASGLPTGATAAFSPTSLTSTATTTLTVTIATSVAAGSYPFTITGTSGSLVQSIPATLTVTPDFSLSSSPTTRTVVAGGTGTFTVTVTATAGLTGATALTVSGLPTNATAAFSPTSVTGSGTSTLTVTVPATVAGGTSTLTITGTNGSKVHSITVTLTVQNFTLAASPTSITVTRGGSTVTDTVTVTMTGGFSSSVALSSSVTPTATGVTITFNPTSRTTTGTSTMSVKATTSTAKGTYTIKVTGTSGTLVQSTNVTLVAN